jgi:hypothetical protein
MKMKLYFLQTAALCAAFTAAIPSPQQDAPQRQERRTKHLRPVVEKRAQSETPLDPVVGNKGAPILGKPSILSSLLR